MISIIISAIAQQTLETKPDIYLPLSDNGISVGSSTQFIQMFIVLAIVLFAIKFFLPKLIFKINPTLQEKGMPSFVIQESIPFASGKLFVVTVHEKKLLLAATTQNINCLADLTPSITQNIQNDSLAFFEVLDATSKQANSESVSMSELNHPEIESLAQNVNPKDIQSVLDRMARFTGT